MPRKKKIIDEENLNKPEEVTEVNQEVTEVEEDPTVFPKSNYKGYSFQDALKEMKIPCSYADRKEIAKANGIDNYLSLGKDNKTLLELFVSGKLKRPN